MSKKPDDVTVIPHEDFTGYPRGNEMAFRKGVESEPIPFEYAELLREKGHIRPIKTAEPTPSSDT